MSPPSNGSRKGLSSRRPHRFRAPMSARRVSVVSPVARQPARLIGHGLPLPLEIDERRALDRLRLCPFPEPGDNGSAARTRSAS